MQWSKTKTRLRSLVTPALRSRVGLQVRGWYSGKIRPRWAVAVKTSALVLSITIGLEGIGLAQEPIVLPEDFQSQVLDERAAKAKSDIGKRGVGKKSKIRVRLRDKHELKGHITQIDEDSFELRVEPEWRDDTRIPRGTFLRIRYAEVDRIRGAKWQPAKVATDIGIVAAAVAILAGIVYLKATRCRHSYCS